MMKKILLCVVAVVVLAVGLMGYVVYGEQRADYGWVPKVTSPTYTNEHPRVVVDQAHNNASTVGIAGRYWPFGRLLREDGYDVVKGKERFTSEFLDKIDILVIVNASGAAKPNFLGINLPMGVEGDRGAPAFASEEIAVVREWVEQGGALLLIADHAPFGAASEAMAQAFDVAMFKGFVELPDEQSDPMLFADSNNRLGNHPIIHGDSPATVVRQVATFTGQSLRGPDSATILLRLPENAIEYVAPAGWKEGMEFVPQPAGNAQGIALPYGKGRVVILGEAAMLTAQVYESKPFGMNQPGNDNQQFALNIMHWLSRKL